MRNAWWMIAGLVLLPMLAWAGNTHDSRSEAAERAAWFGDMMRPHIVHGCVPAVPATSLTTPATPCTAYVRDTTGALVYVDQEANAIGPLNQGNGTYWLAVHRNTSSVVVSWIRDPQSHYLWIKSATQPAEVAERLLVAQITVAGGAITASAPLAPTNAQQAATAYVSHFVPQYGLTFAAIQAAIDSLPLSGGRVIVEPGHYSGSTSITLGNGGVGAASTKHNIFLEGMTPVNHDLALAATVLTWTGGAQPIIHIKGPLVGWGLKNLYLHGGGTANAGVFVVSGQYGEVSNLVIAGHAGNGIWTTCVPTFAGWNGATDALKNTWNQVWVWHLPPAGPGTAGIALDSTNTTCNTDFNTFYQPTVFVAGVDAYGMFLGGSDHNMFFDAHIGDDATTRADVHFAYDNAAFAGWPCANNFYGLSLGNRGMTSSGTPHPTNFCANQIFGLTGGDPADFLPDLPGVQVVSNRRINQNLVLLPSRNPGATDPVGHVEIGMTPSHPRHLVPMVDDVGDLGRLSTPEGAKRFRNIYLTGQVVKQQRAVVGNGTQDAQHDYYVQIQNSGPSTFALQTVAAPYGCGKEYVFKALGGSSVTIGAFGSETIDGNATLVLNPIPGQSAVRLVSDCAMWHIVGRD
jgi:hypothetical protein